MQVIYSLSGFNAKSRNAPGSADGPNFSLLHNKGGTTVSSHARCYSGLKQAHPSSNPTPSASTFLAAALFIQTFLKNLLEHGVAAAESIAHDSLPVNERKGGHSRRSVKRLRALVRRDADRENDVSLRYKLPD